MHGTFGGHVPPVPGLAQRATQAVAPGARSIVNPYSPDVRNALGHG